FHSSAPSPHTIFTLSLHDRSSDLAVYHIIAERVTDPILGSRITFCGMEISHQKLSLLPAQRGTASQYLPFTVSQQEAAVSNVCRSEEHTSELQSRENLVCRLLLEK